MSEYMDGLMADLKAHLAAFCVFFASMLTGRPAQPPSKSAVAFFVKNPVNSPPRFLGCGLLNLTT